MCVHFQRHKYNAVEDTTFQISERFFLATRCSPNLINLRQWWYHNKFRDNGDTKFAKSLTVVIPRGPKNWPFRPEPPYTRHTIVNPQAGRTVPNRRRKNRFGSGTAPAYSQNCKPIYDYLYV